MSGKEFLVIAGGQIYTETAVLKQSALVIKKNNIEQIVEQDTLKNLSSKRVIDFPENYHIIPGFIDLHIHGAQGKDVMDASFESLAVISQALAREGTTSYLATTMTATPSGIENVLSHIRDYVPKSKEVVGAEVLGVHLEGPFLAPDKVGAQRSDLILNPDIHLFERWQKLSNNLIKLVTLAPELPNSLEFIAYLKRQNIVASIGHTNATFAEAMTAIAAGCTHVTHLFNAMRGMHQREPGVVTAAFLSDQVNTELIVDGIHLHPAIVELALKIKTANQLILVTDAMRAKCMEDGTYDLGGQAVIVKQGVANLANGVLAGSTLKMSTAVKNMLQYTQCSLQEIVKMTAENPAKTLGVFNKKGSLASNKDADLVVLDENHNIVMTLCAGRIASR